MGSKRCRLGTIDAGKFFYCNDVGKVIQIWTANGSSQRVDLRNLRAGIYYISYETNHGIETKQLIKVD